MQKKTVAAVVAAGLVAITGALSLAMPANAGSCHSNWKSNRSHWKQERRQAIRQYQQNLALQSSAYPYDYNNLNTYPYLDTSVPYGYTTPYVNPYVDNYPYSYGSPSTTSQALLNGILGLF